MLITIIVLSILLIISTFICINLLKKNEKCEDMINLYEKYILNFSNIISSSDKKINEIDVKGSFSSDDEVGFFFNQIKEIQEQLNNFKVNLNNNE